MKAYTKTDVEYGILYLHVVNTRMKTMSYTIAYLTFEWNYEHLTAQLRGMQEFLQQRDDVTLYVFNAVAKYLDEEVDTTALEILKLPNIADYDGILLQGNRLWPQEERQKIADEAYALGIPVVSINYPLHHAIEIGTDNRGAIRELLKELKENKHIQSAAFVCGYAKSEEAVLRHQAYLEGCRDYGIQNIGCFEAGWQTEDGERVAQEYLDSGKALPDCFVCANDNTARGVSNVLSSHGIAVQKDILVTGFDNQELAYAYYPKIPSIDRNYEKIGTLAVSTLLDVLTGKKVDGKVYSPYTVAWHTTMDRETPDSKDDFRHRFLTMSRDVKEFYWVHSHYEPAMLTCGTMEALCNILSTFGKELKVREVFFSLNNDYFENLENPEVVNHFSDRMHLIAAYIRNQSDMNSAIFESYDSRKILPDTLKRKESLYMIYPLHYGTTIIGCMITSGIPSGADCGFVPVYLSLVETAFENVRRRMILNSINRRLDELYVRDSLTGCYNRFGLEKYGREAFTSYLEKHGYVYLIFADIDNMKSINDQYGHEAGDAAIRTTAYLLKAGIGHESFIMRYGGDEFLIVVPKSYADAHLCEGVYPVHAGEDIRFSLSISTGEFCVRKEDSISFEEAIEKADQQMYEVKKARKVQRSGI